MRCKDIMLATMRGLQALEDTFDSKIQMFTSVSHMSGVSVSLITKLYYGQRKNPTIDVLDNLADAVALIEERRL